MKTEIELPVDVKEAINANRKIDAIKLLRKHSGLGLKEAKDAVDSYEYANPGMSVRRNSDTGSALGRLIFIAILVALIYGVYRFSA